MYLNIIAKQMLALSFKNVNRYMATFCKEVRNIGYQYIFSYIL